MHIGLVTKTDNDTALDLADVLQNAGLKVTLYLDRDAFIRQDIPEDIYLRTLYRKDVLPESCQIVLNKFPRMRDLRSIFTVRKISMDMHRAGIDLVHILLGPAEPWLAVLAHFLRDIPVVTTIIVPFGNIGDHLAGWVKPINMLVIYASEKIILNGQNQVQPFITQYNVALERVIHIPLGARTTSPKWSNSKITEQPHTVLFFGRADPHKGLEYLIRAQPLISKKIPELKIIIAGRGEEIDRCLPLIQDKNAFEIFNRYISSEEMAEFYQRASIVALPYLSASTSGVLLTAYQFGKPVVVTDVGCLAEYTQDGITGFLIPPKNVDVLSDAIIQLLQDEALRNQMGQAAKAWITEENRRNVSKTIKIYENVISQYRGIKL